VTRAAGDVTVRGWAADGTGRPAERVIAFASDRPVAAGVPILERPDVSDVLGVPERRFGFSLAIPARVARSPDPRVRIVAVTGAGASALPVRCSPELSALLAC
jgi:hypothetical protein